MIKLYGLISDNGDGSNSVHWYTNKTLIDYLLKEDETYYANNGSPTVTLNLPDDFNLNTLGTFYINKQSLEEWEETFENL